MSDRIEMMNARSLERSHFEATDWGRDLLRELDLVIAVGELDAMIGRHTLYNTLLNARVADFVAPLDRGLVREHLGLFDVDDLNSGAAQEIGALLASKPRGAMAVLRMHREDARNGIPAGLGHDAWMSNGDGHLSTNSGNKFMWTNPRVPATEFRHVYGTVLSMIIYRQRSRAVNLIVETSVAAAGLKPGVKVKGDHHLNGRSWTTATIERLVENHFVGGGSAWQVRMSKPGHAKSFICEHAAVMRLFGITPVMPAIWLDPGNADRALSLHERRLEKAAAMWPAQALELGLDPERTKYADQLGDGDALERDVRDPEQGHAVIGSFRIEFTPGTDLVSSTVMSERPILRQAA